PTTLDGPADLMFFNHLMSRVAMAIPSASTLVILSQVPPGTSRVWAERLAQLRPSGNPALYYQAETLIFGQAVERASSPERFIVGCADPHRPLPRFYFDYLAAFGCPILPMRYESAELCKIAINCFLASSISTTNYLAGIAEA